MSRDIKVSFTCNMTRDSFLFENQKPQIDKYVRSMLSCTSRRLFRGKREMI